MQDRTLERGLAVAMVLMMLSGCSAENTATEEPQQQPAVRIAQSLGTPTSDNQGKDFWLAFPQNVFSYPELTLFITGATATTGSVQIPGLGFTTSFSVTPGQVTPVVLPPEGQLEVEEGIESKGIHVTAHEEVVVYGLNRITYTTDAYLGLPTDILGTDYVTLGFSNVDIVPGTQFAIVATENNTSITITPAANAGSRSQGVPFTISLHQGQTYQLRSTWSAPADLSGSLISSTKPIAVFGSHQCANIPNGTTYACDHIVEQLPPTTTWGKSFVSVPLATRSGGDTFRFLASKNNTQVRINGTLVATLQRGQLHQDIISTSAHITSTEPILVAQYSNGSSYDGVLSDPFMMLIPPYEQFMASYTVTTPESGFSINYVNLAVPNAAVGQVRLDGTVLAANRFSPIGSSGFSGAQIALAAGTHNLTGPLPFGTFMYGFDSYDSYGYPGGASLAPIAVVTSLTVAPKTGSAQVETEHCLTATVRDQNNQPVASVRVDWSVSGANAVTGFGTTDASGVAHFCYEGLQGGNDNIRASVGSIQDTATMTWVASSPPVARCQPLQLTANLTCGASGSINNGSSDPDGDLAGCTQSPAGPYAVGDTLVTLTCTDTAGNTSSCSSIVKVVDATRPAISCPANLAAECSSGGALVDPGTSTASDNCGVASVSSPGLQSFPLGTTSVTHTAVDTSGNTSTCTNQVTVADTLAPVLTLKGLAVISLECGSPYSDPGAVAHDACVGDLSGSIVTTGSVNTGAPGSYPVSYSVTDPSGNSSATTSRTVTVHDTQAPTIQVNPGPSVIECIGAPYVDPGATASDSCAGDLTSSIVTTSNLNQSVPGQYTVTYSVADSAGNTATASRSLTVKSLSVQLGEYNLFLLEDYTGGHDVQGKVAAGGNITMTDFSVGAGLQNNNIARTLVAGGNLNLSRGGVFGDAHYGGSYNANTSVLYHRGGVAQGTPINFATRFAELRSLSAKLATMTANGTTTRENWGGLMLSGTDPKVNVFTVNASAFTGAKLLSISAPAGSLVVINVHGASATFTGFGHTFGGGIDQRGVLYNFVDATSITAHDFGFFGTMLAPYAHVSFNRGSWDGGIYAKSLTGNAEGHINPLNDFEFCR
jgi:choice-of-anchor A domain-containing protein